MTKLSAIVEKHGACGVYVWNGSLDLVSLENLIQQHGLCFFVLDGSQVRDKHDFLEHAAAVFRFPDYFGKNWDAFAECLTDMSWINRDGFVVVVAEPRQFAENSADDLNTALEIFKEAADFWQKEGKTFLVLIQDIVADKWGLPIITM